MIRESRISEAELLEQIRMQCGQLGLAVQHIHDSRRSWLPGWPDLEIIGPHGILYRELKNASNSLSPAQRRVGSLLTRAGADWSIWRPRDLLDGTIARQLTAISRLATAIPGPAATGG